MFESSAETLDEISRVLKIDDGVMRHLATQARRGLATSAPRDEPPAPAPARRAARRPGGRADAEAEAEPEPEPVAESQPPTAPPKRRVGHRADEEE